MLVEIPSFRWWRRSTSSKGGSTASNGYVCRDGNVSACLVVYSLDSSIGFHCFSIWKLQNSLDRLSLDRTKKNNMINIKTCARQLWQFLRCFIVWLLNCFTLELLNCFGCAKIWTLNNFRKKRQREERLRAAAEAESWSEIRLSLYDFQLPFLQPCHYEWNILDFSAKP